MVQWNETNVRIAMDDSIPIEEKMKMLDCTKAAIYTRRTLVRKAGDVEKYLSGQVNVDNELDFLERTGLKNHIGGFVKKNLPDDILQFYMNQIAIYMKENNLLKSTSFLFSAKEELEDKMQEILSNIPYPIEEVTKEVVKKVVVEKKVMDDPLPCIYTPKRIVLEKESGFFKLENQVNNFIKLHQGELIGHILEVSTGNYILDEEGKNRLFNIADKVDKEETPIALLTSPDDVPFDVEEPVKRNEQEPTISIIEDKPKFTPLTINESLYTDIISQRDVSDIKLMYTSDPLYWNILLALREDTVHNPERVSSSKWAYYAYCDDIDRFGERVCMIRKSGFDENKLYIFVKKCDLTDSIKKYFIAHKLQGYDDDSVLNRMRKEKLLDKNYHSDNENSIVINWYNTRQMIRGKNGILNAILKYGLVK